MKPAYFETHNSGRDRWMISYMDVLQRDLRVMDHTATTLCMENRLPIVVFDLMKPGNVRSLLDGQAIGTLVC